MSHEATIRDLGSEQNRLKERILQLEEERERLQKQIQTLEEQQQQKILNLDKVNHFSPFLFSGEAGLKTCLEAIIDFASVPESLATVQKIAVSK